MKKDVAFSGLEAAIVLIAFVVVAAVFSYVMLGAGFFATQKSQEVTYSGIKQATSNMVLDGAVYGKLSTVSCLGALTFYMAIPEGGQAQNLADTDFVWQVGNQRGQIVHSQSITFTPSTAILTPGSKVKVVLHDLWGSVKAGNMFTLEIKPKVGAATMIQKTLVTGFTGGVII